MDAKDLRIGNLVNYSDQFGIWQDSIRELRSDYAMLTNHGAQFDYNGLKPILLTDEWLLKFGFERLNNAYQAPGKKSYLNPGFSLWNPVGESEFTLNDTVLCPKTEYVHQLQNLYFALTGTELELIKI